ncbi:hypothetical protein [Halomarina rubra]|uniref:Uncharacterized protein n=1 Tax=Halomarina rubra TaxID=2071873 RepID=A0ABD6AR30_9EURY|nr:hypothetical protein [Halomarina rubra]
MALAETLLASKVKLALVGLLVVTGVGAGAVATGAVDVDGVLGQETDLADTVPDDATMVMRFDSGVVEDDTTKQMVNAALETQAESSPNYDGPESYTELIEDAEEESADSDLSLDGFHEAVVFGDTASTGFGGEQYVGVLVRADWTPEEVVNASESEFTTYEETTVKGYTVYEPNETSQFGSSEQIGVVEDGVYVIGTPDVVRDTLAVAAGDESSFDGELREQYDSTQDGYFQFAMEVPQQQIPDSAYENSGAPINTNVFADVRYVSGAYYTDGDTVGMAVGMATDAESDAEDIQEVTDGGISLLKGTVENETAKETLDDVTIERDGTRVTLTFEQTADEMSELVRLYYRMMAMPLGATGPTY